MERTVVLSTNHNPDYLKYLESCQKAWNTIGWKTLTFYHGPDLLMPESNETNKIISLNDYITTYRPETLVQTARLLGGWFIERGLIMTGDVDMLPLKNYWKPSLYDITCYGHDLTGFTQIPICYIAMDAAKWREIIPEHNVLELLDKYPNAKSQDWNIWWSVDQQIITERIEKHPFKSIKRGFDGGLARGRVDRFDWAGTLKKPGEKIDAHMPRPFDQSAVDECLKILNNGQ